MTALSVLLKLIEDERTTDLTVRQAGVLCALAEADGQVDFGEVSRRLCITKPCLSRAMDKLVAEGMANRISSSDDRRRVLLSISSDGRKFVRKLG